MKENLMFSHLGNGISVTDRNETSNNDYKTVAHISEDGSDISYRAIVSLEAEKEIENWALDTYFKKHVGCIPVLVKKHHILKNRSNLIIDLWSSRMINERHKEDDSIFWSYIQLAQPLVKKRNEITIKLCDWIDETGNKFTVYTGDEQTNYFQSFSEALLFYHNL